MRFAGYDRAIENKVSLAFKAFSVGLTVEQKENREESLEEAYGGSSHQTAS